MHQFLLYTITDFGAKETEKFQEITRKIEELRQETFPENNSGAINKNRVSQLISELQVFASSTSNSNHGNFPVVSTIF
jgi:hypothetical protein